MVLTKACRLALLLLGCTSLAQAAPAPGVTPLIEKLRSWGEDPVLVAAVRRQNAAQLDMAQIRQRDANWRAITGIDGFMYRLMRNRAAMRLRQLEKGAPYYTESFLMDARGANVAMTKKTSDYWQGDEDKFRKAYRDGRGGVHVGQVRFDPSTQNYLAHISVPVLADGRTIGVLAVGINLDRLAASRDDAATEKAEHRGPR